MALIDSTLLVNPWSIIPADHKWLTRAAVADIIVATLESLRLAYPTLDEKQSAQLAHYREELAGAKC